MLCREEGIGLCRLISVTMLILEIRNGLKRISLTGSPGRRAIREREGTCLFLVLGFLALPLGALKLEDAKVSYCSTSSALECY